MLTLAAQTQIARRSGTGSRSARLPGFLWTRALVCELIERRFGVRATEKTAGRYLRVWGFSPQKPARRALEQNPELVARWLEERYPESGAARHASGRCSCGPTRWACAPTTALDVPGRRSGRRALVQGTGQRFGANVISAISNKGRLQFSVFKARFTAAVLIDFLTRLLRQADGQKIILILDGHPVHRAKKVRAWAAAHAEQIELQFLPGYSPELNPTELLNQDVKTNALGRRRPRSQDELIVDTRSYLRSTHAGPSSSPATSTANTSATPKPHDGYLPARSSI